MPRLYLSKLLLICFLGLNGCAMLYPSYVEPQKDQIVAYIYFNNSGDTDAYITDFPLICTGLKRIPNLFGLISNKPTSVPADKLLTLKYYASIPSGLNILKCDGFVVSFVPEQGKYYEIKVTSSENKCYFRLDELVYKQQGSELRILDRIPVSLLYRKIDVHSGNNFNVSDAMCTDSATVLKKLQEYHIPID
jgi:hypothetical protein